MHKKNNYSPKFKVQTVLEGLKDPDGIAAYCRRKGITEVSFYNWQKQMIDNADTLFDKPSKATSKKIDRLEKEIQRKDRIISVVTEEALELKKTYGLKKYKRLNLETKLDLLDMLRRYSHYGWSKKAICQKWDISIKTFYTFNKTTDKSSSASRCQLNKITSDEQMAVISYALKNTELRHREMAFRMIDEDIAFMSPSSVYRILREYSLICKNSKLQKPDIWHPHKGVTEPDPVWQTDLMILKYKGRDYYLLSYMDVYSRFIVYHRLCLSMSGHTIKEISKEAFLKTGIKPNSVQSDNGSCYISQEYRSLMDKLEIDHRFIHPHCPNENAEIERYHRTLREYIDITEAENFAHLEKIIREKIEYYNYKRYHSKIGFIPPYLKYRGNPEEIFQERKNKLEKAKTRRMQLNYQRTKNTTSQNIKIAS